MFTEDDPFWPLTKFRNPGFPTHEPDKGCPPHPNSSMEPSEKADLLY